MKSRTGESSGKDPTVIPAMALAGRWEYSRAVDTKQIAKRFELAAQVASPFGTNWPDSKNQLPMKNMLLTTTVLLASCGVVMAQPQAEGRIYIGNAKDAPAWVWNVSKASANTNQTAANAAWVKWLELTYIQQQADAQKAALKDTAVCVDYAANPRNRMLKPEAGGVQLMRQRGIVLDYNPTSLVGVISGEDGKRWLFRAAEWIGPSVDSHRGLWVDFVPESETGFALFISNLGPITLEHLELESPH